MVDGNWLVSKDMKHPPLRSLLGQAYNNKCKDLADAYGKCVDSAHLNTAALKKDTCKEPFAVLMKCVREQTKPKQRLDK